MDTTLEPGRKLATDLFTDELDGDTATSVMEIAGRNYLVDHAENRISFLDSRFYQTPSGAFVPSVTTILDAYPKGAAFYEWLKRNGEDSDNIRDEAGRRGSVVHDATERLDLGQALDLMTPDGSPQYRLAEWAMIERYVEFREQFPARIHAIETKLASDDLGYAGTLDRILMLHLDGKLYLMDIKTSGAIHNHYWLQQAAYIELAKRSGLLEKLGLGIPEPAILWLNAKTRGPRKGEVQGEGWQLKTAEHPTEHYLDLFNKTHALWLAENAGQQPRQTTYRLKHQLKQSEQ